MATLKSQPEYIVDKTIEFLGNNIQSAYNTVNNLHPADRQIDYRPYTYSTLPIHVTDKMPAISVEVGEYEPHNEDFGGGNEDIWRYDLTIHVSDNLLTNKIDDRPKQNLHRMVYRHAEAIREAIQQDRTLGGVVIAAIIESIRMSAIISAPEAKARVRAALIEVTVLSHQD